MRRALATSLSLCWVLCACGGGNGDTVSRAQPASVETLAYVMTECRVTASEFAARQELRIQRPGEPEKRIAAAAFAVGPFSASSPDYELQKVLCTAFGLARTGRSSVIVGRFQRLGVSPNGAYVVFEVNDRLQNPAGGFPPSQPDELANGFYIIGADGSGLRRLAPASRDDSFRWSATNLADIRIQFSAPLSFSPDGRRITYTDCAACDDGECAPCNEENEPVQIVTLDLFDPDAHPRFVTSLPFTPPPPPPGPGDPRERVTSNPRFVDNDTIVFTTIANALQRQAPPGEARRFTVKVDGTELVDVPLPLLPQLDGSPPTFDATFEITGQRPTAVRVIFSRGSSEVFYVDGQRFLQLTNFGKPDTSSPFVSIDGERVFFVASLSDPPANNPNGNCQIFSIPVTGGELQQVTPFVISGVSENGCGAPDLAPECGITSLFQDSTTEALVFDSSCNPPENTNPAGGQMFAIWPDGSGLHQLTTAQGLTGDPNGDFSVELPGPFAASAVRR